MSYYKPPIIIWGQIEGAPGTYARIKVKSDGTVIVEGTATISGDVNVTDKWTRQLGQVDLARVLGSALSVTNPVIAGLYDASGNRMPSMDSALRPGYVDVIDRAARLLGIVYGSLGQLQQRATSLDLYTALRQSGSELSTSNPIFTGIVDASGNRMPSMDASTRPGYVDIIDRAGRLLGVVYGSQAQQLLQRASTYEALVTIRQGGAELSATNPIYSSITDVTKVATPHYYSPVHLGAGGTGTIWTPAAGKKIRLKRVQISVNAATQIDLRFVAAAFETYFLPANGSVVVNFVGTNREGAVNEALTLLTVGEATVTASADGDEI